MLSHRGLNKTHGSPLTQPHGRINPSTRQIPVRLETVRLEVPTLSQPRIHRREVSTIHKLRAYFIKQNKI